MKRLLAAALLALPLAGHSQSSSVPNLISYQSRVADASGTPIGAPTPVNRIVLFRIYDSAGGSARLYSEQQTVTIANGEFSVLLGSGTQIGTDTGNTFSSFSAAVFGGATRFLGVTVDDGDGNPLNDPEMSPRQQIATTPFAFRSAVAESVALGGVNSLSLANNSVGTAAIASAAITNEKLATDAVGTTQVTDNAITLAKHAANSVDSSKIVDGSIALADLTPALQAAVASKPSYTYNQGLVAFSLNSANEAKAYNIFPIDLSDLAVDGEVLISYVGGRRGSSATGVPAAFGGKIRVHVLNFTPGSTNWIMSSTTQTTFSVNNGMNSVGASPNVAQDAASTFFAESRGPSAEGNFTVSGTLNGTSMAVTFASPPATPWPYLQLDQMFPRAATVLTAAAASSIANPNHTIYTPSPDVGNVSNPIGYAGSSFIDPTSSVKVVQVPMVYFFHYYPGSMTPGNNSDLANISTATNFGPAQSLRVSSVQTGTNKLTITTENPHTIGVGDSVTLASVTGTPTANGTFTVAAVPDRTSFEINLSGATGTYSGGTISHTLRYNKYRFWVAVHMSAAVRVIVSDK